MDAWEKKSDENFDSAGILREEKHFNAAMNCLYHAAYLLIYRKLIFLGLDNEDSKDGKHKKVLDYLYGETRSGTPSAKRDASVVHSLMTSLKSSRVKANYKREDITPEEYERCFNKYRVNEAPLKRIAEITDDESENA